MDLTGVSRTLYSTFPVTLLNIYGPNSDDPTFFRDVFDLLPEDTSSNIYISGDFNCYLDSSLDRSSTKVPSTITSVQTLNNLIKSRNMVDIWRIQHPDKKKYSFYSHVHQSFTRIDYFIVEASSIPNISNTNYHSIFISDHSPVALQLQVSFSKPKYKWRFNPLLLSSPGFKEYIKKNLREFLEINDNGEVSDSTLWESLKATIRGYIISFETSKKKAKSKRLKEIEHEMIHLEQIYKTSLQQSDYKKILKLKSEYNSALGGEISSLLLKMRQKHFELSDKPQKLLSRQFKGDQARTAIYKIQSKQDR